MNPVKIKRFLFLLCFVFSLSAKGIDIYGVYPTHWWVGMKNPKLQLLVRGQNVSLFTKAVTSNPGVKIEKVSRLESKNYLVLDLTITSAAKAGVVKIILSGGGLPNEDFFYELKERDKNNGIGRAQGVSSRDFIYLLMPDRFSNGDPSNDIVPEYKDRDLDRKDKFARHGGDFKGIENHFDYFNQLGVTTLWLTPVIENDMPRIIEWGNNAAGYHGYWFTDHYAIDKRYGGNQGYKDFCNRAHAAGLKVIQDAVYNHVGNQHWFVLDPPMKSWFNTSQGDKAPNHREEVFYDPYVSQVDKTAMLDGWFVPHLPDLNQRNPYVAIFLIQHAIWTT
jgi:hypothetical protein